MLGVSMITALTIQNNGDDIVCSSGEDKKSKKWKGFIHLYKEGRFHCELISTDPAFDSSQLAEQRMQKLVEDIRKLDLLTNASVPQKDEDLFTLSCSACGYKWETDQKVENCPRCEGHGRPDPKCTCSHYRGAFGIGKINVIAERNPECPIHKEAPSTQQTQITS